MPCPRVRSIVQSVGNQASVLSPLCWVSVPWPHAENPYLGLLGAALESESCHPPQNLSPRDALRTRASVLHVHWVWLNKDPIRNLLRRRELAGLMETSESARRPVVWTMHNADPHDGSSAEREMMQRVARAAQGIVVHSPASRDSAMEINAKAQVRVIPHGPLRDAYGPAPERSEARTICGLPERTTILCFGQIRPYRGVQELLAAFKRSRIDATLLIVGSCPNPELKKVLQQLAHGDPRIDFIPERVPDELVPHFFSAADLVVLPYRSATTSGVANLAMGYHRALLLPDVPSLVMDLPSQTHTRIEAAEPLEAAIARALARPAPDAKMFPRQVTWAEVAHSHRMFFDQLCG